MNKVKRICAWCKNEYTTKPTINEFYCSASCYRKSSKSKRETRICFNCGVQYSVQPNKAKRTSIKTFCSWQCRKNYVPTKEIIDDYLSGFTSCEIGDKFNLHPSTVTKLLKRNAINARPSAIDFQTDGKSYTATSRKTELSTSHKDVIDGLILSDGHVRQRAIAGEFSLRTIEKEFAEHIQNVLPLSWRMSTKEPGKCIFNGKTYNTRRLYTICTACDLSLNEFVDKWYSDGTKIIPQSLSLSPTLVKYWFYGDGSSSWHKNHLGEYVYSNICLCTNCFTKDECEFLIDKLKSDAGIDGFYVNRNREIYTAASMSVSAFFDYIGEPNVSCFSYKWKIPKNILKNISKRPREISQS